MGNKSIEDRAIRNADKRPYTFQELEMARVFESFTRVCLPADTHPRELYGIPTPPNSDDALDDILRDVNGAAEERRLLKISESRDALVEHRLQSVRRFWNGRERKMLEVSPSDEAHLAPRQREALEEVRKQRKGPDLARSFETFYAEILRRTGEFTDVVLSNDQSDILAGCDLFVNIAPKGRKPRWVPVDVATGESYDNFQKKIIKDNKGTLPITAMEQTENDGMPDDATVLFRRVEFMDFYVLRSLFERMENAAVEQRLVPIEELWVKGEDGWFLSVDGNPPAGVPTWHAPTPVLSDEEFLVLLAEAFEDADTVRRREQKKHELEDPDPNVVAKWPTDVDDMVERLHRDLHDANDPVDKKHFGWKSLRDEINALRRRPQI